MSRTAWPNQITGANAGGPHQLAMRTRWTACVAQFRRWIKEMKTRMIFMLLLGLVAGCATYEQHELASVSAQYARENWMLSFRKDFLELRQEAIVVPPQYKIDPDPIKAQIMQDGYITGYDHIRSGYVLHTDLPSPPSAIAGDEELATIWRKACQAGSSNGRARFEAYRNEHK